MLPLSYSKPLTESSQNHANYLSKHVDKSAMHINMHAERVPLAGRE